MTLDRGRANDESPPRTCRGLMIMISLVTLLAGLNLTAEITARQVADFGFVRWRELVSLLCVTPVSIVLLFRVVWTLEQGRHDAAWPLTASVAAVGLLGISMGIHEPINAIRDHPGLPLLPAQVSESLWFWDDVFSHAVFFAGYVGTSLTLIWSQVRNPLRSPMDRSTTVVFLLCAVVGGIGIFYSLVDGGRIRIDLTVMTAALAAAELIRKRRPLAVLPVALTIEGAYVLALVLLVVHRLCVA